VVGSATITQDPKSNFVIGSQTLTPGASGITVNGQVISAGTGGAVIVNAAPTAASTTGAPGVVVIGSSSITANSDSGFVIGSQTLFPGSAITADGEVITLPSPTPTNAPDITMPAVVIGSSTFTENAQSQFVIGSQTLTPGGVITVGGSIISLAPTGGAVIVNGVTEQPTTFSTATGSFVPTPVSSLVIAGQTLTAGGKVTIGGDILSLAPSGTGIVVIGTVTVGGGESTATATAKFKNKNAGEKTSISFSLIGLQISFMIIGAFWLH